MNEYQLKLHPWKVVRSTVQKEKPVHLVVAHCRNESDAQGQLQVFQRSVPGEYTIKYCGGLTSEF